MTGTVPSASAITSCCDTPPLMMVSASHQEYVYAETSIGLNLVACDQQVALTSSAALVAHATHFIDQTMDWDSTNQKYIQSSTYSDALDLDVPGSYTMSFQKTSRYETGWCRTPRMTPSRSLTDVLSPRTSPRRTIR